MLGRNPIFSGPACDEDRALMARELGAQLDDVSAYPVLLCKGKTRLTLSAVQVADAYSAILGIDQLV